MCKKNGYFEIIQVQKWKKRLEWMLFCTEHIRTHTYTIEAFNFQVWFLVVNSQTRNSVNNYELLNLWHVSSNIQNIEHYCFVRPLNKNKLNDDVRNLKQSTFIVSNTTHYDSTLQDCKTKPYLRSPIFFFFTYSISNRCPSGNNYLKSQNYFTKIMRARAFSHYTHHFNSL